MTDRSVPNQEKKTKKPTKGRHFVSLDVLTVGSSGCSGGTTTPPSLFLSIWQESVAVATDPPVGEFGKLLSRYALSGTLNSRVVADQRYRIGAVQALFVGAAAAPPPPSLSPAHYAEHHGHDECSSCSVEAIISLLYALARSGSEELVVVAPTAERYNNSGCNMPKDAAAAGQQEEERHRRKKGGSRIQDAVELLHGSRAYPKVQICELDRAEMQDTAAPWWRVYEDDTSIVHAHWSTHHGLVYLVTLRDCLVLSSSSSSRRTAGRQNVATAGNDDDDDDDDAVRRVQGTSLLYIPERANIISCQETFGDIATPKCAMPVFEEYRSLDGAPITAQLWCVVVVAAAAGADSTVVDDNMRGWIFLRVVEDSLPQTHLPGHHHHHHHRRLLRRGGQQQERWKRIYPSLRTYFPWHPQYGADDVGSSNEDESTVTSAAAAAASASMIGKTILMKKFGSTADAAASYCIIDRLIGGSTNVPASSTEADQNNIDEASLRRFLSGQPLTTTHDSNEICLDDSDDDDEYEALETDTFLQILGTGCAAPSPHRNASAQLLVLQGRSILLDAGEGTAIQWDRHLYQTSMASIGMIWISHAHWDHFGGLIDVLRRIYAERNPTLEDRLCAKRHRVESPFVVAPTKILQYIDAVFGEPNVVAKYCQKISPDDKMAIHRMISAFNQQLPQVQIVNWQHALVDHSCRAYAVRIDLALQSAAYSMVFSGDTRPTRQVTNLCLPQVDLLIHEATYADNDLAMAKTKKHSTRSEALAIGNGIAKRTLLTHFSQRYSGVHIEAGRDERTGNLWMTAVDGLRMPIKFPGL